MIRTRHALAPVADVVRQVLGRRVLDERAGECGPSQTGHHGLEDREYLRLLLVSSYSIVLIKGDLPALTS